MDTSSSSSKQQQQHQHQREKNTKIWAKHTHNQAAEKDKRQIYIKIRMTVFKQKEKKWWHIVQNRFHVIMALAHIRNNCSAFTPFTIPSFMLHSQRTLPANRIGSTDGICAWCCAHHSTSTTHCAHIYMYIYIRQSCRTDERSFIGLVNVVFSHTTDESLFYISHHFSVLLTSLE